MTRGKELGYSGDDLRKFVEGQQRAERDERAERRKFELEQLEMAQMKRETELALKEKELELESLNAKMMQPVRSASVEINAVTRRVQSCLSFAKHRTL